MYKFNTKGNNKNDHAHLNINVYMFEIKCSFHIKNVHVYEKIVIISKELV